MDYSVSEQDGVVVIFLMGKIIGRPEATENLKIMCSLPAQSTCD
jgi:hypothetical protein